MEPLKIEEPAKPPAAAEPEKRFEPIALEEGEGSQEVELAATFEFIPTQQAEGIPFTEEEKSRAVSLPEELQWEEDKENLPPELTGAGEAELPAGGTDFGGTSESADQFRKEEEPGAELEQLLSPLDAIFPEPEKKTAAEEAPPLEFLTPVETERPEPPLPGPPPPSPAAPSPPEPILEDLWDKPAPAAPAEEDIWDEKPADLEYVSFSPSPSAPSPEADLPPLPDLPPLGEAEKPSPPVTSWEEIGGEKDLWNDVPAAEEKVTGPRKAAVSPEPQRVAFLSFEAPPPDVGAAPETPVAPPPSQESGEALEDLFRQVSFEKEGGASVPAEEFLESAGLEPPPALEDLLPPSPPPAPARPAPVSKSLPEPDDLKWMEEPEPEELKSEFQAAPSLPSPPVEEKEKLEALGEMKQFRAAADDSPEFDEVSAEIGRLQEPGDTFLDTREVKKRLARIAELEEEIKTKEFQFNELLNLMMKKELGEITQELFMKELQVLKAKMESGKKKREEKV